jgi:multicomponent Na+:H+ antiporter subunit E
MRERVRRFAALWIWSAAVWMLLTWTATAEQLVFGAALSTAVAFALTPLGAVAAPWQLFTPKHFIGAVRLMFGSLMRIVRANVSLTRRIWSPSLPLRSGMIIVPTTMRSDGELAAVGLISSLIVDNQIVDLDRSRRELQYHAVAVPEGTPEERVAAVNGPIEERIVTLSRDE